MTIGKARGIGAGVNVHVFTFLVVHFGLVREAVEQLLRQAFLTNKEFAQKTLQSLKHIEERLRTDPREFGEPRHRLKHVEVRVGVVSPVAVQYAVHDNHPVVFVLKYSLLSPPEE